ncbi:isoprimeverose transporter [Lachnospiraceae bacterium]|nr:isoprimeverose transporter [Lachnospiraceae bacterium]
MTGMLALFFLMYSVNGGATVYYAKDILGDRNLVGTINGIFNVVQIAGMFFIAMLVKKYGKRNVFAMGLVLNTVGMMVLNYSGGAMWLIVVSSIIRGVGNACGGATMWAMVSDTIDYGEWKTGVRTEGLVNSACSFGYKIGNGIGSALLGLILEIGGYVGEAAQQTSSALASIRICFIWIPVAVYITGLVIMKFYHLDEEFAGIIEDLKKRGKVKEKK